MAGRRLQRRRCRPRRRSDCGLVAIVFAWRGSFAARLVTIVVCLVPALTGLPVYFISDIPAEAVISVSIGNFWALLGAILLLLPGRRPAH